MLKMTPELKRRLMPSLTTERYLTIWMTRWFRTLTYPWI
jgi:hypothetical protein